MIGVGVALLISGILVAETTSVVICFLFSGCIGGSGSP
jgi:hypothetical protein